MKGQLGVVFSPKTIIYRTFSGIGIEEISKLNTKINLGYFASVGFQYQTKNRVSYIFEIIGNSSTIYLKKGEYIKFQYNNQDLLLTMKEEDKKWNYVTELKNNSTNNDQIIESYLMNSLGLNLGIQYSLHK